MDFYNQPVPGTFALDRYHWFYLPKNNNIVVKVIAVSSDEASYWIVAYTILVTLIFAGVTRLVVDLVLAFLPVDGSGNRIVMLVAFYNANNPTTATILMLHYCLRALFNTWSIQLARKMKDWHTLRCALMLVAISGSLIGATLAAQFLVSGRKLIERHATRANASVLFYPDFITANNTGVLLDQLKPIRGSAGFQALGRYETSRRNLQNRVQVDEEVLSPDDGRPMVQYNYGYQITGYEMGLQNAPELKYNVQGFCKTDYSTYSYNQTDDTENWTYWPSWPGYEDIYSIKSEEIMPPFLSANINPDQFRPGEPLNVSSIKKNGFMFGLTPHTSFRLSTTQNLHNPWYMTEPNRNSNTTNWGRTWRVKRGRPGLRCVQNDTYTLRGQTVYLVDDLKDLRDLKLSKLLQDYVFPFEFGVPPITQLALNLGLNNLASSLYYFPNSNSFTADKASLKDDIKKLVSVSFLYSREVARNIFLVYSTIDPKGLQNLAAVNGVVPYDNADVILESSDVAALSLNVLIVTPIVCIVVWILVCIRLYIVQPKARTDNTGALARLNLRTIGFQATHLYRCLDEQLSGQRKWSGRLSMAPFIKKVDKYRNGSATAGGVERGNQNPPGKEPFALPKLVPDRQELVPLLGDVEDIHDNGVIWHAKSVTSLPGQDSSRVQVNSPMLLEKPKYDLVFTRDEDRNLRSGLGSRVGWNDVMTDCDD